MSLMSKGDGKAKGKCKGTAQDEAVAEESEIPPPPAAPLGVLCAGQLAASLMAPPRRTLECLVLAVFFS